jgi:ribosomal protein S1
MAEESYEATKIEKDKGDQEQSDVDTLIAGALKELEATPKEEKLEKVLKATPISIPTPPPKPMPAPTPQKAETPAQEERRAEEASYEESLKKFQEGALVKGKIARLDPSGALVDIGYKSDGLLSAEEIPKDAKVGDQIDVVIEKLESKEGYMVLSHLRAEQELKWKTAYEAYRNKTLLEVQVKSAVMGGLVVDWGGMRSFIPASQVAKSPEQTLESFVGQAIPAKVIEVNRRQGKVVLSHRLGSYEAERQQASKIIDEIESGQVRKGRVTNLKSFGAFVDLGGIEGLIPLSELSWKRVKHPSEVLKSGSEIEVFVLSVDRVNKKISLGLKELQPDPWAAAIEKYKVGQVVKGKVLRLAKFGAFVEIEEGLEGLVHISELSLSKVQKPEDVVKSGDILDLKILRIIPEEQKIGLSRKEVLLDQERAQAEIRRQEESKVTIGEMIAEKERAQAEHDAEFTIEEIQEEAPPE